MVNARGGRSIRIGARETPTEARAHLPDAAALRSWLRAQLIDPRERD